MYLGDNMRKKWIIQQHLNKDAKELAEKLHVSEMIADILIRRGFTDSKAAKEYLDPKNFQPFYNPFLLRDMDKAVNRIVQAIVGQELIVVYGDYDVDGMTATSVLVRQLRRLGGKVDYYVPLRKTDGYGLHIDTLERVRQSGVKVLISVDCGITAVAEVEAFKSYFDIIITDHHLPDAELPDALAVIDPKRQDDYYPDNNIAGVGVAYKLCQALWQEMGKGKYSSFTEDIELVAMGTIADMVSLLKENRKFAKLGLQRIPETRLLGLKKLLNVAGLGEKKKITATDVGFGIAPRFNAVGRMDNARKGIELLLTDDEVTANELAIFLNTENNIRKSATTEITNAAEDMVKMLDVSKMPALVLAGENWHSGVVGLVASRLQEKYYLPVITIGIQDGIGKGSCRSIKGLHIKEALTACEDVLLRFGGHEMAAGITVEAGKISAFREKFYSYVRNNLQPDDYIYKQIIEFVANEPQEISYQVMEDLSILEPFGKDNEQPSFACFDVKALSAIVRGNHLFFFIGKIKVIGWGMAEKLDLVKQKRIDFIFKPEINVYQGKT